MGRAANNIFSSEFVVTALHTVSNVLVLFTDINAALFDQVPIENWHLVLMSVAERSADG